MDSNGFEEGVGGHEQCRFQSKGAIMQCSMVQEYPLISVLVCPFPISPCRCTSTSTVHIMSTPETSSFSREPRSNCRTDHNRGKPRSRQRGSVTQFLSRWVIVAEDLATGGAADNIIGRRSPKGRLLGPWRTRVSFKHTDSTTKENTDNCRLRRRLIPSSGSVVIVVIRPYHIELPLAHHALIRGAATAP